MFLGEFPKLKQPYFVRNSFQTTIQKDHNRFRSAGNLELLLFAALVCRSMGDSSALSPQSRFSIKCFLLGVQTCSLLDECN